MKAEEKRNLIILIVVVIIIIAILAMIRGKKVNSNSVDTSGDTDQTVAELESGTRLNVSEKLAEKKYFSNFEVSNIQLIEKAGKTQLLADVKNVGSQKIEVTTLEITFYDKEENELTTVKDALIPEMEPGGKTKLNISTNSKCIEAYDFSIKIAEGGAE